MRNSATLTLVLAFLTVCRAVRADSYTFTTINPHGSTFTVASGLNDAGVVVGSFIGAAGGLSQGFIYHKCTYRTFEIPGAAFTNPYGINNRGQIVGDFTGGGFLDTKGVITIINGQAGGINNYGHVVGTVVVNGQAHGFLYVDGVYTTFDVPGATGTSAWSINDAGEIVGYSSAGGFLDKDGVFTSINDPHGGSSTQAYGINNRGQIVGTFFDATGQHGFVDEHGIFTTIDVPGSSATSIMRINDASEIVGIYTAGGELYGFIGRPTYRDSNDAGQVLGNFGTTSGERACPQH